MHWRRKWQPTPVFLPGESQGRGAWWAAVYGVAQSRTRLKRLSSSSSFFLSSTSQLTCCFFTKTFPDDPSLCLILLFKISPESLPLTDVLIFICIILCVFDCLWSYNLSSVRAGPHLLSLCCVSAPGTSLGLWSRSVNA